MFCEYRFFSKILSILVSILPLLATSQQTISAPSNLPKFSVSKSNFTIDTSGAQYDFLQLHYDNILSRFSITNSSIAGVFIDHSRFSVPFQLNQSKITHYFQIDQDTISAGPSYILKDHFLTYPVIRRNAFNGPLAFSNDTFSNVKFLDNEINSRLEFIACLFSDSLTIKQIEINDAGSLVFLGSSLPSRIFFLNNTKLKSDVDFQTAKYDSRTIQICVYGSDISKLKIDYLHFRLFFPNDIFNGPNEGFEDKVAVYEGLLSNFRTRGQLTSVENLDLEYRKFRASYQWYGFLYYIHLGWNKCGYAKIWVILWTIGLFIGFSIWTSFKFRKLSTRVYTMENIPDSYEMHKWQIRWYSVVYTANIFFRLTLKMENLNYERKGLIIYVFFVYLVGIFCLAYIADLVLHQ